MTERSSSFSLRRLLIVFPPDRQSSLRNFSETLLRLFLHMLRIPVTRAFRANSVGKLHLRVIADVCFDLLPIPTFFLDLFAGSANPQYPGQRVQAYQRLF